MISKIILYLFAIPALILCIFAHSLFGADFAQEAVVTSEGAYVDKEHHEGAEFGEQAESKTAWKQEHPGIKSWCYANCWGGDAESSIRSFYTKGFEFKNVKPGVSFKADIAFQVSLHGLINASSFAFSDNYYRVRITAGILQGSSGNYNAPLTEVLLWAKTNKKEWSDWGQEVLWTTAGEIIGEAAGQAAGAVVGVVWDTAEYALEAMDVDESVAQNAWVRFEDFPAKAGKEYRVYVCLDAYTNCASIYAGSSHSYIDFYHHPPHEGDDGGKLLPVRGIGIGEVTVSIPAGLPYPEGVGPNRPDLAVSSLDIQPSEPRLGDTVTLTATVNNRGKSDAPPFSMSIRHNDKEYQESVEGLGKEQSTSLKKEFRLNTLGKHTFTAEADPADTLSELNEHNNRDSLGIELRAVPDLVLARKSASGESPGCGVEGIKGPLQRGKPSRIWAEVKNRGNTDASGVEVMFEKDGVLHDKVMVPEIQRNRSVRVSSSWTPERSGEHMVRIVVDPGCVIQELDEANNSVILKAPVGNPDHDVSLLSLDFDPPSFLDGEKVRLLLEVSNKGSRKSPVELLVSVDGPLVGQLSSTIGAGETVVLGDGKPKGDDLLWTAEEGEHTVTARLKPRGYNDLDGADNTLEKKVTVRRFAPVSGVDLILRDGDVDFDGRTWRARVYNRGSKAASTAVRFTVSCPEQGELRTRDFGSGEREVPAGGHRDFTLEHTEKSPYRIEIRVDPDDKVKEKDESNNCAVATRGDYQAALERMRQEQQKQQELQRMVPLEIAEIRGTEEPLQVGEERYVGVGLRNVSGQALEDILVELHISHTQPGLQDEPQYGAARKMERWPQLLNRGEFQVLIPYKGVYPGRFKLFVQATVDHAGKKKTLMRDAFFSVEGGDYPPHYYRSQGTDLAVQLVLNPAQKVNTGETVSLSVTVQNLGPVDIPGVSVSVQANGMPLCTEHTPGIRARSSASLKLSHTPQAPGPLSFDVLVDPEDRIGEVNENNNHATAGLAVHGPGMQKVEEVKEELQDEMKKTMKQLQDLFK
jgi:hypothetical protein